MMRILLPPSEGKTAPPEGPTLALDALSFPDLGPTRRRVLDALVGLCRIDPGTALAALGLGPSLAPEVERNAELLVAPCAPAWRVYSGVLYTALDFGTLPSDRRREAEETLAIGSALFGLTGPCDAIPAYRLSGTARLPGLPTPKRLWSGPLADALRAMAEHHLIVDMRSQTYAGWFQLRGPQWVGVRVMTLRDGRRVPVSHHNKAAKGLLTRDLVCMDRQPSDADELVELLGDAGWRASAAGDGLIEVLTKQ